MAPSVPLRPSRPSPRHATPVVRSGSLAALSLAALALSAAASALAGQEVRGRVVASEDGSPVGAAFLSLLSSHGLRVDADLTRADGFFELEAPAAGSFVVRVERIGFEDWTSPPFDLDAGQVASVRYEVRLQPVRLSDLRVSVRGRDRECVLGPGPETAVMRVWNEARKVLEQTRWMEEHRIYRFSVLEWERKLGSRAERVRRESVVRREWEARTPFRSLPIERLAERGFVREESGRSFVYYAPDAATLLSYRFAESHCFGLRWRKRDGRRFVGLAFEPLRDRRLPEIGGVLWIDEETAALEWIEFRYVNLPFERGADAAGGRVELERLPSGGFVVRRWWVRMPIMEETVLYLRGSRRTRHRVLGYEEDGAEVVGVFDAEGRHLLMMTGGSVSGSVRDSVATAPLEGTRVTLVGPTDSSTVFTDAEGRFRFDGLASGSYRVRAVHPRLLALRMTADELGWTSRLSLQAGERVELDWHTPSGATLFDRVCPRVGHGDKPTLVSGTIRSAASGRPVEGAWVSARWEPIRPPTPAGPGDPPYRRIAESLTVRTDDAGSFRLCGVPAGVTIELSTSAEGFQDVSLALAADARVVWRDLELERR